MDSRFIAIVKNRVHARLDTTKEIEEKELYQVIEAVIGELGREEFLTVSDRLFLKKEVFNSIRRLDIIQDILDDESVTEIMINGPDNIFIEKKGRIIRSDRTFESREKLEDIIQQIAAKANRLVNESTPILDTRLADGSRVNIVLSPVSIEGPTVTIRKFYDTPLTMDRMIELGSITQEAADFLKNLVKSRCNIFISGGTGSGKTTFLNALSDYIPENERIITIEDSAELQIHNIPNLVRLETRNANVEGRNAITIRDLIRSALRMRPDRIIIGEVRGEETIDMLQVLNTGHSGSLSTGHGNSARDMLSRLETMVLMGMDNIPLIAVKGQIASAIEVIVHLKRFRDGARRVEEIIELNGITDGQICVNVLYRYEPQSGLVKCNDVVSERLIKIVKE